MVCYSKGWKEKGAKAIQK